MKEMKSKEELVLPNYLKKSRPEIIGLLPEEEERDRE